MRAFVEDMNENWEHRIGRSNRNSQGGAVTLELKCPKSVNGIGIDPQPDWSFDMLLSEINSIEKKLNDSSVFPRHFTKKKLSGVSSMKPSGRKTFVMRIDEEDFKEDSEEEDHSGQMVVGTRFTCDGFYASDPEDFEDESPSGSPNQLMEKAGLVEGALSELTREHQIMVTEEIRNYIYAFETDLIVEKKQLTSAIAQVKRNAYTRREMDKKVDIQYQRNIAEALDHHLTAVQRDHEHKSQIEERRIKDDAAVEEAKRREKALVDEKLRQERIRAEAQARLEAERKKAEEAKAAALEAEKRAAKEAADKVALEKAAKEATSAKEAADRSNKSSSGSVQQAGDVVRGAENALKIETRRQQIYKEIVDKNTILGMGSTNNLANHGSKIQRLVKTTSGTKEKVRNSAQQLTKIFSDPSCPQSLSIITFAEKIATLCTNDNFAVFPQAHVIVLVSSQIPLVMDLVLAKLNAVCIYTVPKYIRYVKTAFDSSKTYKKIVGYIEDDGEIESEEGYISRMKSYMKLYGALVQTEIQGVRNTHGLEEGWAWLARFLNALPANRYTAIALQAFLEVAGFAMHRRYRNQFKKLLNVIHREFLKALIERSDHTELSVVITNIETYIESNKFLLEPEGRTLQDDLESNYLAPELEHQHAQPYYNQQPNRYTYHR